MAKRTKTFWLQKQIADLTRRLAIAQIEYAKAVEDLEGLRMGLERVMKENDLKYTYVCKETGLSFTTIYDFLHKNHRLSKKSMDKVRGFLVKIIER